MKSGQATALGPLRGTGRTSSRLKPNLGPSSGDVRDLRRRLAESRGPRFGVLTRARQQAAVSAEGHGGGARVGHLDDVGGHVAVDDAAKVQRVLGQHEPARGTEEPTWLNSLGSKFSYMQVKGGQGHKMINGKW